MKFIELTYVVGVGATAHATVDKTTLFNPLLINVIWPQTFKVHNMGEVNGSVVVTGIDRAHVLECPERIQRLIEDATKDRTTYNLSFQPT